MPGILRGVLISRRSNPQWSMAQKNWCQSSHVAEGAQFFRRQWEHDVIEGRMWRGEDVSEARRQRDHDGCEAMDEEDSIYPVRSLGYWEYWEVSHFENSCITMQYYCMTCREEKFHEPGKSNHMSWKHKFYAWSGKAECSRGQHMQLKSTADKIFGRSLK